MFSNRMGRRKFIKTISSTLFGIITSNFMKVNSSSGGSGNTMNIEYRTLGRTGLKVTAVSMGVMNCSDPAVLLRAYDLGINFYDTADCYMHGHNEEMVGRAFQGKRDKILIQTKVHVHDEKKMRASVERSLRRLQTDYIDVLLWHGHSSQEEVSDPRLFEFMLKMKREGKVRFSGFSTHKHMASLLREAAKTSFHDVALVSYNFTHSKDLKEAVAMAAQSGMGIIAMKTQGGGYKKERMGGLSPHQAALKYILMDSNVSAAIPGVTTIEQIEECAAVMGTSFSQKDFNELRQYQSFLQGRVCTMCGGCIGECTEGSFREDLLRGVMYGDGYEDHSLAKEALKMISMQNLKHCLECPSCSVTCQRGLNIKDQIRVAGEIMGWRVDSIIQNES